MRRIFVGSALLVASVVTIGAVRPRLAATVHHVKATSDVYALPPPEMLPALSLGWRAALADLLFVSTIISYGIHGEEHRRFEFVGRYLDSVLELDPSLRDVYRFADTLLIYQPSGTPDEETVRHARRIVERGLRAYPDDGYLHLSAGQFLAFIATQFLTDDAEKADFRKAGARAMARAGELDNGNQNVQWQALAASGIFTREGEHKAARDFLRRAYAMTDDGERRANIAKRLAVLEDEVERDRIQRHNEAFGRAWRSDLPFASRNRVLVIGPMWSVAECAGSSDRDATACTTSWAAWSAGQVPAEGSD